MKTHILFTTLLATLLVSAQKSSVSKKELLKSMKLPPCKACKILVESFKKVRSVVGNYFRKRNLYFCFQNLAKTEKGKFEGGDTAWEEEKLGSYAKSEVRLVEIQENICKEIDEGQNQCFSMAEMHDSLIEEWWFKHQDQESGNDNKNNITS